MKKNNSKDMILAFLTLIGTYFVYYYIGYLLNTDVLNAVTYRKDGMTYRWFRFSNLLSTTP
jgi:hypothetical protein